MAMNSDLFTINKLVTHKILGGVRMILKFRN